MTKRSTASCLHDIILGFSSLRQIRPPPKSQSQDSQTVQSAPLLSGYVSRNSRCIIVMIASKIWSQCSKLNALLFPESNNLRTSSGFSLLEGRQRAHHGLRHDRQELRQKFLTPSLASSFEQRGSINYPASFVIQYSRYS